MLKDFLAARGLEAVAPGGAFDTALDPGFLLGVLDMHELDADRAAIAAAQDVEDFARGGDLEAEHVVDEDRAVHVGFGEAVGGGVELGMRARHLQAERVELGLEMAAHPVGADHHQRVQAVLGGGAELFGVGGGGARG